MMSPQLRIDLMQSQQHDLERNARHAQLVADTATETPIVGEDVALRLCTVADDPALERLAELEGRLVPSGRHLVALVDGQLVASLPLVGGAPLADPFRPTAHLMPLLRLRAAQLEPRGGRLGALAGRMIHPAR